ncbi:hypothetical protein [Streptacidiphilus rugosus]|uniref:hypothetical protein n=1 Tax=Streptacidiphilus rugosus TaxID=405783 RepID=UPI0006923971|nr:hypothetical protein [Streptacidiphilus rugosus]
MNQQPVHSIPAPVVTVAYDADGRPYYLPATTPAAPLMPYQASGQAAVPATVYQPAPLPAQPTNGGYSPLRDPIVMRLLAGGIGLGATGVGLSFLFTALAAATTAIGLLLGVLALVFLLAHSGGGRGAVNVRVDNRFTNRNR